MKTYNVKLKFNSISQKQYWLNILKHQQNVVNEMFQQIFNSEIKLSIKHFHDTLYKRIKNSFNLPSQIIIKSEQEALAGFRSVKSNKHKLKAPPVKKNLSLRLDKRLYSNFTRTSIKLATSTKNQREAVSFQLYDKINSFFENYTALDPLIFERNGELYLSITFETPEILPQNEEVVGVDLGVKRLFTTSDGTALSGKEYNKQKRRIRYNKRMLQKKNTKSSKRKLKKLSKKEKNFSKNYIHQATNKLLETDKSIIVVEDLTKIKQNTSKTKEGFKRKKHNNRISQIPFYMFKQILTYKALHLGKVVETVNPAYTSQIDCTTNEKDGKRQGCRYYTASNKVLDADWNAAINIACRKHPISFEVPTDGKLNFLGRLLSTNQTSELSGKPLEFIQGVVDFNYLFII
jgi:putative transposase